MKSYHQQQLQDVVLNFRRSHNLFWLALNLVFSGRFMTRNLSKKFNLAFFFYYTNSLFIFTIIWKNKTISWRIKLFFWRCLVKQNLLRWLWHFCFCTSAILLQISHIALVAVVWSEHKFSSSIHTLSIFYVLSREW